MNRICYLYTLYTLSFYLSIFVTNELSILEIKVPLQRVPADLAPEAARVEH